VVCLRDTACFSTKELGDVGAVAIGPISGPVVCYGNTSANLAAAIEERITKKKTKVKLTAADRAKVTSVVDALLDKVFTPDAINGWAEKLGDHTFSDLRSKAWSEKRYKQTLQRLLEKDPRQPLHADAGVKHEVLPLQDPPKPPRMLLADGDESQVMSLPVISCLEHLLFEHFPHRNIKHRPSEQGVRDCLAHLAEACGREDFWVVEGDGSAWDTTCSTKIRALIENRIIRRIGDVLGASDAVPQWWRELTQDLNEREFLRVRAPRKELKNGEKWCAIISAIRRSGHRGTSVLNWLINFVLWSAALLDDPTQAVLQAGLITLPDGSVLAMSFEGDDSILAGSGWGDAAERLRAAEAFWQRAGFRMKLRIHGAGSVAEFCGWHCLVGPSGPDQHNCCPDLRRNVACGAWTESKGAVACVKVGDLRGYHRVGLASNLSRYLSFAGSVPLLAQYYLQIALWHHSRAQMLRGEHIEWERSHLYKHGELPSTITGVLNLGNIKAASRRPATALLEACGLAVSPIDEAVHMASLHKPTYDAADHLPRAWLPTTPFTLVTVPPKFLPSKSGP
jgi:hypothetical protein